MAEIFQRISNHSDNRQKVFNIAGKTEEEAMKYLRYLHRNALFGTHTGLPPQIKNSKINESLVSNIGDYSVIDVYAKQLTKCMIGTVVNFILNDTVNPLGETYVYPCTDKNKPMGYMISDATPDTMGVCLVHGVLEVPLYYFGEEGEKRNYVEYDIENACFKFSDSGYPVYNVYQDVDGDWIAIILFGDMSSSDYEYDGPFAVSLDHYDAEVPSKMWISCKSGRVILNQIYERYCEGFEYRHPSGDSTDELLGNVALSTGESLWLETSLYKELTGSSYDLDFGFLITTGTPSGDIVLDSLVTTGTNYFKIAENNKDEGLVQIQYGEINYNMFMPGENTEIECSKYFNPCIKISSKYHGPFDVDLIGIGPIYEHGDYGDIVGCFGQLSIEDSSDFTPVSVGNVIGGQVIIGKYSYPVGAASLINFTCEEDTTVEVYLYQDKTTKEYKYLVCGRHHPSQIAINTLANTFHTLLARFNVYGFFAQVQYGDVVQPEGTGGDEDLQDLVIIPGIVGATVGITEGETSAKFKGEGNTEVTMIRRYATEGERLVWGERSAGIAGSTATAYKAAGWRGIYHAFDGSAMTEVSESANFLWQGRTVEVEYPLIVPSTTDEELNIISRYMSGLRSDIPQSIRDKAQAWAQERITQGLPTFYNYNGEDTPPSSRDDALRNVDSESIIISSLGQEITSELVGTDTAYIGLTGSRKVITLLAGENVSFSDEEEEGDVITINCTAGGGGGGSGEDIQFKWYPRYTSGSTDDRIISITGNTNQTYSIGADWNDGDNVVFNNSYLIGNYPSSLDFYGIGGGDVIVELPNASTNSLCIKIYTLRSTGTTVATSFSSRIVVVAPDGTPILNEDGGGSSSTYNAQFLNEPGLCVYIFNPNCRAIEIGGSTYTSCWHSTHFA